MMPARSTQAVRLITLLIVLVAASSCGDKEDDQIREPVIRPVKLITLSPASNEETSRYPAVVNAAQFSELSFLVGGLIEEIAIVEAQQVNEGDLIARLDQRDYQSQLDSAQSQFQNAEEEYQRAVRLSQEDAIALSVLEQRESQRVVAKSQFDTAEKALQDTVIRAPFAGAVVQVPVRERQNVSAGQLVAALMGHGKLEVTVDVPASVIAEAQQMEDNSAFVILDTSPEDRIEATFTEANLLADTASQTYSVTFTFEPPSDLVILPGMNATLELSGSRNSNIAETKRISVPLSAIVIEGNAKFVWVVDQDSMTVSRREVTVADGIGDTAVVTEGLTLGDTIATAGASYLSDGMQVRPWTE